MLRRRRSISAPRGLPGAARRSLGSRTARQRWPQGSIPESEIPHCVRDEKGAAGRQGIERRAASRRRSARQAPSGGAYGDGGDCGAGGPEGGVGRRRWRAAASSCSRVSGSNKQELADQAVAAVAGGVVEAAHQEAVLHLQDADLFPVLLVDVAADRAQLFFVAVVGGMRLGIHGFPLARRALAPAAAPSGAPGIAQDCPQSTARRPPGKGPLVPAGRDGGTGAPDPVPRDRIGPGWSARRVRAPRGCAAPRRRRPPP